MILKVTEGVGLTSCLSVRLDNFCQFYKKGIFISEIDSSAQFNIYKDSPSQDISKILLEKYNPNIIVPKSDFKHTWQFRWYDEIGLSDLNKIAMNVCNLSQIIKEKARQIRKTIGNRCVILYRGNDKSKEIKSIPYDEFIKAANNLRESSFFIQTDEKEFYDYFKSKFPDSTYNAELPMIHKDGNMVITSTEIGKGDFAIKFLASIYAISSARKLIIPTGNTGLWAVIYRGILSGVVQLKGECLPNMYCYKVQNGY